LNYLDKMDRFGGGGHEHRGPANLHSHDETELEALHRPLNPDESFIHTSKQKSRQTQKRTVSVGKKTPFLIISLYLSGMLHLLRVIQ
jgi:hypothetical protein